MQTPSCKLMCKIMLQLQQEKLLTVVEANKIEKKILSGKIKSEDWRLAVELSMDKESTNVEKNGS
ncbi:MAG: hypothetical protein Q7U66_08130 [Methylobacter sp.]|nr:hypothetical protein [Methylobacter sp.]